MNTIKYTIILGLIILTGSISAQKLDGYILTLPALSLDGGGKVYVEDFANKNNDNATFGKAYATAIKNALAAERVAVGNVGKIHNPWITTKVYEITDSKDAADYIITGDYEVGSSSSSSNKAVYIAETGSVTPKIPVCYYDYTISNSATIKGNLHVTAKGQATPMKSLPIDVNKGSSKTKAMEQPDVESASSYIAAAEKEAIQKYQYYFSPVIKSKTYKFNKLKAEDKAQKKTFKQYTSDLKDMADKNDIMSMGKLYKSITTMQLKDMQEGYMNMAMCYEIIGNYTKAKEFYEKAGDKSAIAEIKKLISNRDKLAPLGLNVVENDF